MRRNFFHLFVLLHILLLALLSTGYAEIIPNPDEEPLTDEAIWERINEVGTAEDHPGHDQAIVFDYDTNYIQPGEWNRYKSHSVVKLLTWKAVRNHSSLTLRMAAFWNREEYESVRIFRVDGSIEEVDLTNFVESPSPVGGIIRKGIVRVYQMPPLEVNDSIEYIRTGEWCHWNCMISREKQEELGLSEFWHYTAAFTTFSNQLILEKKVEIITPRDFPLQFQTNYGPAQSSVYTDDPEHIRYVFQNDSFQSYETEPHMRSIWEYLPYVELTSLDSWKRKSQWYYHASEPFMVVDETMKAKVAELCAGLHTDEEKINVLTHWVGDNIRYAGLHYDPVPEGYLGQPAPMTFRYRVGVCKENALLLATLLREAGIEAYTALTLINSTKNNMPDEGFNHAFTVIHHTDGTWQAVDATGVGFLTVLLHQLEQEQSYIAGTPEGVPIMNTPIQDYRDHELDIHADTILRKNGDAECAFQINLKGYPDSIVRSSLRRLGDGNLRSYFEQWIKAVAPQAEIQQYCFTNPRNYDRNMSVKLSFVVEDYAIPTSAGLLFIPPTSRFPFDNTLLYNALSMNELEERQYTMSLGANWNAIFHETIALPQGYHLKDGDASSSLDYDRSACTYKREFNPATGELYLEQSFAVKRKDIPPEDYPQFREVTQAVKKWMETYLLIEPHE